jgi:hypothetical protein
MSDIKEQNESIAELNASTPRSTGHPQLRRRYVRWREGCNSSRDELNITAFVTPKIGIYEKTGIS